MIEKLYPNPINLQASSVYPFNEFSLQELLNKFFQTINECVESSNKALDFVKWLKEEGLPPLVEKEIEDMYNDGRLEALIDKYTGDIKTKLEELEDITIDNANNIATHETRLNNIQTDLTKVKDYLLYNVDTTENMKLKIFTKGSYVKTQGFYNKYDNAGALFFIDDIEIENKFSIKLTNNLYANLIGDTVSIKQIGAHESLQNNYEFFNKACKYKNIIFNEGTYKIEGNENIEVLGSIEGFNTTINITGYVVFDTSNAKSFTCKNININLIDVYNSISVDSKLGTIFYSTGKQNYRLYENINFFAMLNQPKLSYEEYDGEKRSYCCIHDENCGDNSIYSNITSTNFQIGIKTNGNNMTIKNINLYNFETGIYILDGNSKNYTIYNINGYNTFSQSFSWCGKTNNPLGYNGKDLILCDGNNVLIYNIHCENPIERCIYSQASNVTAYNMYCSNAAGFKFVGKDLGNNQWLYNENSNISNMTLEVNQNMSEKTHQQTIFATQVYFVKNFVFKDFYYILNNSVNPLRTVATITLSNEKIMFENINAIVTQRMIQPSISNGNYNLVCDGLIIKNSQVSKGSNGLRLDGTLFGVDLTNGASNLLTEKVIKNIIIKNNIVKYTSTIKDNSVVAWNNLDNAFIEVNSLNQTNFVSGLPNDKYENHENVTLKLNIITTDTNSLIPSAPRLSTLNEDSIISSYITSSKTNAFITFKGDNVIIKYKGYGTNDYIQFNNITTGYALININGLTKSCKGSFNGVTQTLTLEGTQNLIEVRENGITLRGDRLIEPFSYDITLIIPKV